DSAIEAASGLGLARMLLVSRLNLAAMLMNMRRFGEARDVIGLVEQDTAVVHMGPGLGAALLTLRGMSELFEEDGERDRHTRLRAAESLFRQAMETDPAADATSLVENSYYLACCLVEQGRVEEAGLVLDNADRALSDALSSIRSNIYRDSILETPPVRRFVEMRRRIGGCP
ncbi:hypothetical protein JW921_09585, partial [Candidatus Fermentibacterales bacterium]|nr:hypothetical protein [Candidatus Fermentibacterales bacterium]